MSDIKRSEYQKLQWENRRLRSQYLDQSERITEEDMIQKPREFVKTISAILMIILDQEQEKGRICPIKLKNAILEYANSEMPS